MAVNRFKKQIRISYSYLREFHISSKIDAVNIIEMAKH